MKNFNDDLKEKVDFINELLKGYFVDEAGMWSNVTEAMNYSVDAGGKRIRPMIMLETYKLCGGSDYESVYPFMAALEFIHTYSLVHYDLPAMDNDDYRRGMLTTHKKFGEDFGILAGDGLLNRAYEIIFDALNKSDIDVTNKIKAANVIAHKAGVYGMVGGQSLDVYMTDKKVEPEQLDFIFRLKTGALLEASFMAGGYLAGKDEETIKKLEKIGYLTGFAFQIKDDILDVTSTQEVLGKPVFSDEKNNKTTYVSLYGMDKAQKDVAEMSNQAISLVEEIGDNEFLVALMEKLIHRNK